ncbi:MAG TPA: WD40 repeat domain-containing protein [Pirellulales bacterium]|nr:WD40 repeat domain-containing protein [Pirellulales bacterium]
MRTKGFSLAELFLWVAMCAVLLAWVMPWYRDLSSIQDLFMPQALAISADGSTAAAADFDGRVRLWDVNGRSTLKTIKASCLMEGIALSSDGRLLAMLQQSSAAGSHDIEVWDVRSGEKIDSFPADRHSSFAFSPREPRLASVAGKRVELRSYGNDAVAVQKQLASGVKAPAAPIFTSDGRRLVVGSRDRVECFDAGDLGRKSAVKTPVGFFFSLSLSPDGRRLLAKGVSTDQDHRVLALFKLYDAATGEAKAALERKWGLFLEGGFNASAGYLPDGRILLAASGQLQVFDPETLAVLDEPLHAAEPIECVATPPSGTIFLAGGRYSIDLWDAQTMSPVWTLWNSPISVSHIKQKIWHGLLLLPMVGVFTYLLRWVRSRNHRCKVCGERFLPQFIEDWRLGCASCRATGRISEQEIARFERNQRYTRRGMIFCVAIIPIAFAGFGVFCWLKEIPAEVVRLLSPILVMKATMVVIPWFTLLFQPPSAKSVASRKLHAAPSPSATDL